MNRGALCAPKDAFFLFLCLQSSNDVCTQSGLVLLLMHFEVRTLNPYSFTFHASIAHVPPSTVNLLKLKTTISQTNRLYKFIAHCPSRAVAIFRSVRAHLSSSHLHGSGCPMVMPPVPSSILEFQEASTLWSLDLLHKRKHTRSFTRTTHRARKLHSSNTLFRHFKIRLGNSS